MGSRKRKKKSRSRRDAHRKNKSKKRSKSRAAPTERSLELPLHSSSSLDPPGLVLSYPPVHIEKGPRRVPDPYTQLDLDPNEAHTPDDIRAAWRRQIELHPPEREPEAARAATAARDRLIAPEQVFERKLGRLHAPDPKAFGLPIEERRVQPTGKLGSRARILGQLALYAILEEELTEGGAAREEGQQELPF